MTPSSSWDDWEWQKYLHKFFFESWQEETRLVDDTILLVGRLGMTRSMATQWKRAARATQPPTIFANGSSIKLESSHLILCQDVKLWKLQDHRIPSKYDLTLCPPRNIGPQRKVLKMKCLWDLNPFHPDIFHLSYLGGVAVSIVMDFIWGILCLRCISRGCIFIGNVFEEDAFGDVFQ